MLTYRWVLIFSIVCAVIAAAMLVYDRFIASLPAGTDAIPFTFLFTGLLGIYVGEAIKALSQRVDQLERQLATRDQDEQVLVSRDPIGTSR